MTVAQLLKKIRGRLVDKTGPDSDKHWQDWELIDDYAENVRRQLFQIVKLFTVSSTIATDGGSPPLPLCVIPVTAGVALYPISPKIIETTRFRLASVPGLLPKMTMAQLDRTISNWFTLPAGIPRAYCADFEHGKILLVPPPMADDTAHLSNLIYPLTPLTHSRPADELGFDEEYHDDLIPGILAQAFAKDDVEVKRPDLEAAYETRFMTAADRIRLAVFRKHHGSHTNSTHG